MMAENGIIYVAFYAELYILISIVLLLKTKVDLCNPAFIFWSAYTVLLGLGPVVYGFYRSNFVFVELLFSNSCPVSSICPGELCTELFEKTERQRSAYPHISI